MFTGKFMPWDQGKTWSKLPLVDMEIRTAESAGMDSYQHIVGFDLWFGYILILELPRSLVDDGFHVETKRSCGPRDWLASRRPPNVCAYYPRPP